MRVKTRKADLTDPADVDRLVRGLDEAGVVVDVLVNNAGIGIHGPFASSDPERLERPLQLNVLGLTRLTRRLLPDMLSRGRGRIVNVTSVVAYFKGGPNWSTYVASKAYAVPRVKNSLCQPSITRLPGKKSDHLAVFQASGMPKYSCRSSAVSM